MLMDTKILLEFTGNTILLSVIKILNVYFVQKDKNRSYICENKQRKNKVIKIEDLNYFNKLRQNSSYVDLAKVSQYSWF